jgi:hypothetical protein
MAAGIPATSLLCARKTRPLGLVVCKSDAVAGIEIIPLEPDQCSDLRREAPSVTLTSPPLRGADSELLTFSLLFYGFSNNWATNRCSVKR